MALVSRIGLGCSISSRKTKPQQSGLQTHAAILSRYTLLPYARFHFLELLVYPTHLIQHSCPVLRHDTPTCPYVRVGVYIRNFLHLMHLVHVLVFCHFLKGRKEAFEITLMCVCVCVPVSISTFNRCLSSHVTCFKLQAGALLFSLLQSVTTTWLPRELTKPQRNQRQIPQEFGMT